MVESQNVTYSELQVGQRPGKLFQARPAHRVLVRRAPLEIIL